jgi:hypothetical protein
VIKREQGSAPNRRKGRPGTVDVGLETVLQSSGEPGDPPMTPG